jgi:ankyrin repeat protein
MLNRGDIDFSELENDYDPLLDACEKDLTEAALLIIDSGKCDVNIRDSSETSWTPLMHAVGNNNEILVSKLLEKDADVDEVDTDGNSAVHIAVINDNDNILSILLRHNPQKNLLNGDNLSPLDLAKINESEECVKLLI